MFEFCPPHLVHCWPSLGIDFVTFRFMLLYILLHLASSDWTDWERFLKPGFFFWFVLWFYQIVVRFLFSFSQIPIHNLCYFSLFNWFLICKWFFPHRIRFKKILDNFLVFFLLFLVWLFLLSVFPTQICQPVEKSFVFLEGGCLDSI